MKKLFDLSEKIRERDYEICVANCGTITDVKKDTPVERRMYYVEGAGQLCPKCYDKIYTEENMRESEKKFSEIFKNKLENKLE